MSNRTTAQPSLSPPRLDYLDALRGIAAMMVVVFHYIGWHWSDQLSTQIANLFFNGRDAVSFFFVLSGFVLAFKYLNFNAPLHLGKFIFRRILRLYPAFLITIVLNWATWMYAPSWAETIDKIVRLNYGPVLAELSMILYEHTYYVPGWSLGVEMRISILMPLLIIIAQRQVKLLWLLWPIVLFIQPPFITGYLFHFVGGVLIATYFQRIKHQEWKKQMYYPWRYLIYLVLFILFNMRVWNHLIGLPAFLDIEGFDWSHYSALASMGIIIIALMSKSWQSFLQHPTLLYLGKISYGIYLSHWIFIVLVMQNYHDLKQWMPGPEWITFAIFLVLCIVATLVLAHLLNRYIEEPAMKWARSISKQW